MSTPEKKKINGRKVFRVFDLIIRIASLLMLAPVGFFYGLTLIIVSYYGGWSSPTEVLIFIGQIFLIIIVTLSCIDPPFLLEKVFRKKIISEILGRVPAYVYPVYFYLNFLPIISAHATAA